MQNSTILFKGVKSWLGQGRAFFPGGGKIFRGGMISEKSPKKSQWLKSSKNWEKTAEKPLEFAENVEFNDFRLFFVEKRRKIAENDQKMQFFSEKRQKNRFFFIPGVGLTTFHRLFSPPPGMKLGVPIKKSHHLGRKTSTSTLYPPPLLVTPLILFITSFLRRKIVYDTCTVYAIIWTL